MAPAAGGVSDKVTLTVVVSTLVTVTTSLGAVTVITAWACTAATNDKRTAEDNITNAKTQGPVTNK